MTALYNLLLYTAAVLTLPWWLARVLSTAKYRDGFWQRAGRVPAQLLDATRGKRVIWLHAVSVGEARAALPIVQQLRKDLAEDFAVVISTTTATGQQVARQLFGAENVFYFPLDFRFAVRRYLSALKPAVFILMESEFWPNILTMAAAQGTKVLVLNGRVSDRSYPRYLRLRRFWQPALQSIAFCLAQSEIDARRLRAIGIPADRVEIGGNLKFDVAQQQPGQLFELLRQNLPPNARVLLCGSTLQPEERELIHSAQRIAAFVPDVVTIIAPRHPERFDKVAAILPAGSVRRSEWALAPTPLRPGTIFLLDSVGELASLYPLASVAFIGGSLVNAGGHNPLEAALAGVPVVMGRSVANFRDIAAVLERCGALIRVFPDEVTDTILRLLQDPRQAQQLGRRGQKALEANRGATARAMERIEQLLAVARV